MLFAPLKAVSSFTRVNKNNNFSFICMIRRIEIQREKKNHIVFFVWSSSHYPEKFS